MFCFHRWIIHNLPLGSQLHGLFRIAVRVCPKCERCEALTLRNHPRFNPWDRITTQEGRILIEGIPHQPAPISQSQEVIKKNGANQNIQPNQRPPNPQLTPPPSSNIRGGSAEQGNGGGGCENGENRDQGGSSDGGQPAPRDASGRGRVGGWREWYRPEDYRDYRAAELLEDLIGADATDRFLLDITSTLNINVNGHQWAVKRRVEYYIDVNLDGKRGSLNAGGFCHLDGVASLVGQILADSAMAKRFQCGKLTLRGGSR